MPTRPESRLLPRRALVLALLLVAVGAVAYVAVELTAPDAPVLEEDDVLPAGRWHLRPELSHEQSPEELARVLSLPYQAGSQPGSGLSRVTVHDSERAQPGVNLYVSGHAPEAVLIDMDGELLHRWRFRFEDAFPDKIPSVETPFFRRAHLLPGGDLLAIYQGGGLVRLNAASKLVWKVRSSFYNDFFVAPDGSIHTLTKAAKVIPSVHPSKAVLEDALLVVDAEGDELSRTPLLTCFRNSPFADLLRPMATAGDIFHSNTVQVFDGSLAHLSPTYAAGNVLVSLREVDIVAIVDPGEETVVWAQRGPWSAQHEPTLLPNGVILLFDNRGADERSRVLELDPASGEIVWEYRGSEERQLWSREAGSVQRLANGNTLITESEQGRAVEITREGEIVWEFYNPHRTGPRGEYVATLFDVQRLDASLAKMAGR